MRWLRFFLSLLATAHLGLTAGAQVGVTTQHNDNARTGQNVNETVLTPAAVNVQHFGKLFSQVVDGKVYAQPLYLTNVSIPGKGTHNVVYVATEHDSVYAFDADTNSGGNASPLWKTSLINPSQGITSVSSSDVGCNNVAPEIGVTGTPVIDSLTGTLYVVAKINDNGVIKQRLHALDVTTGTDKFGGPVLIKAKVRGTGDGSKNGYVYFNPRREHQRAGLLLQNGAVYVGWGSHCDIGPYHGWIISYDAHTLAQTGKWNSTPNGGSGGFWQAGSGLAADASFNLFVPSGNGTFDANLGGLDYGDSIIKLTLKPPRIIPMDYFTPYNQDYLNRTDTDLGSGGVVLLPDQTGPHQHLLVQAGKEGSIYLVDRDQMGHFNPDNNNQIVQFLPDVAGGLWSTPAWWSNNLYVGGINDYLRQFTFDPGTGLLSNQSVSESATFFRYPGATASISANGDTSGIVWVLQTDDYQKGGPATLHAYDATDLSRELYNTSQNFTRDNPGRAVNFTLPTIVNGKVYVPAVKQLSVYGLLN